MERDYYLNDLRLIREIEEFQNYIYNFRRIKLYKTRNNPFEELDEISFRGKYRFNKITAVYVIDLIKNDLIRDSRGGGLPPYLQVLTAIRTWARREIQDDAGDLSGISQPQVCITCKKVALALAAKQREFIKMPQSDCEQNQVIADLFRICGFRQVIGAIDCTHIWISKVSGDVGQYYINRKGYSSINVQVVSNAKLEIMDIVAHWRGSTHDSRIFNCSTLKQRFERGDFKGRLLGDGGYACTSYLFTPLTNPGTPKEEAYNSAHIRTRNTVERCFGVWKQRFRCLLNGFTTSLENTKLYVVALAVLHNIAIMHNDLCEEVDVQESEPQQLENLTHIVNMNNNMRGNASRAAFIEENF